MHGIHKCDVAMYAFTSAIVYTRWTLRPSKRGWICNHTTDSLPIDAEYRFGCLCSIRFQWNLDFFFNFLSKILTKLLQTLFVLFFKITFKWTKKKHYQAAFVTKYKPSGMLKQNNLENTLTMRRMDIFIYRHGAVM